MSAFPLGKAAPPDLAIFRLLGPDPHLNHARVGKEQCRVCIWNGCRGRNVGMAVLFHEVLDKRFADAGNGPFELVCCAVDGGHRANRN